MGAGLSGSSGQASPVKRRHDTNAAPGSGPGRASHCLVCQTATAVQLIALTTQGRSAAGRAIFGSVAEQVFASVPTSLLLLHPPKGEQTASGPIVSTSYQTIIVLLDGSVEAERALHQATSLAQACQTTLVLVAVPPRPGEEIFV